MRLHKNDDNFHNYDIYFNDIKQDKTKIVAADDQKNYIVSHGDSNLFHRVTGSVKFVATELTSFEF